MSTTATRQPPAVRYPFAPSRALAWALAWVALAGAAAMWAWWHVQQTTLAQFLVGAVVWSGASLLAWRWWRGAPSGELIWDGSVWCVRMGERDDEPCLPPFVSLDLQSGLWLRLGLARGGARWVWFTRDAAPGRWRDLRRALFARQVERLRPADRVAEGGVA